MLCFARKFSMVYCIVAPVLAWFISSNWMIFFSKRKCFLFFFWTKHFFTTMFWTSLILRLVLFSFELHGVSFCLNFYKLNFCHFFYSERTTIFNLYWSIFLIQPFFFLERTNVCSRKRVLERMYVWFCTERVFTSWACFVTIF